MAFQSHKILTTTAIITLVLRVPALSFFVVVILNKIWYFHFLIIGQQIISKIMSECNGDNFDECKFP